MSNYRIPVIISEVSPSVMRARLLVIWQTFTAVGIFFGAAANVIFEGMWQHQIGIAFVPAVPFVFLCYVIPEFVTLLFSFQYLFADYIPEPHGFSSRKENTGRLFKSSIG